MLSETDMRRISEKTLPRRGDGAGSSSSQADQRAFDGHLDSARFFIGLDGGSSSSRRRCGDARTASGERVRRVPTTSSVSGDAPLGVVGAHISAGGVFAKGVDAILNAMCE